MQNLDHQILASASRTTTQTSGDFTNDHCRGVKVIVDITSAGTGSITPKIQGKSASGVYYDLLTSAALTSAATTVLTVYPGATASANVSASDVLPRTWRVVVTANNANAMTYTVDSCTVL